MNDLDKFLSWNKAEIRKQKAAQFDPLAEPEGEIKSPDAFNNHASLVIIAKDGMDRLQKHYPGWRWAIQINQKGGMMSVFNLDLHGKWGYTIRILDVQDASTRKMFVTAGGEILARFHQPRGRLQWEHLCVMPRDAAGDGIPILNDLEHAQARKELKRRRLSQAIQAGRMMQGADGRLLVGVT